MATSKVRVLVDEGPAQTAPGPKAGSQTVKIIEGGGLEFSKTEAEELAGSGRVGKAVGVFPEMRNAKIITLSTEASGAECAKFVKSLLGNAGVNDPEKVVVVKGTEWKEESGV